MVQGMAFLSKKGFNPQNQVNRKQVWEAQQQSKLDKERIRQREEQLRREREDEELCAARHNGDGSQAQLRFMYDAPPGLKKVVDASNHHDEEEKKVKTDKSTVKDLSQVQPGDDAAAAAFRRMLAASSTSRNPADPISEQSGCQGDDSEEQPLRFAPVLQGSTLDRDSGKPTDARSALEKAVGRKDRGSALTLEEQIARFPQLKNAPMAKGMSATDVNVSFKPLGAQVRNVKCLACGVWGHSRGDRECRMTGWDPFSARPLETTAISSSMKITKSEISSQQHARETNHDDRRSNESDDDSSSRSSSSSSDFSSRARRKRKHRSKRKKKNVTSDRKRKKRRRSRSPSSKRRKKSDRDRTTRTP